jgi:hypothetical protein
MSANKHLVTLFVFDFAEIEFNLREIESDSANLHAPKQQAAFIQSGEALFKWLYQCSHSAVYEALLFKMLESQYDKNKTIGQLQKELAESLNTRSSI